MNLLNTLLKYPWRKRAKQVIQGKLISNKQYFEFEYQINV